MLKHCATDNLLDPSSVFKERVNFMRLPVKTSCFHHESVIAG